MISRFLIPRRFLPTHLNNTGSSLLLQAKFEQTKFGYCRRIAFPTRCAIPNRTSATRLIGMQMHPSMHAPMESPRFRNRLRIIALLLDVVQEVAASAAHAVRSESAKRVAGRWRRRPACADRAPVASFVGAEREVGAHFCGGLQDTSRTAPMSCRTSTSLLCETCGKASASCLCVTCPCSAR